MRTEDFFSIIDGIDDDIVLDARCPSENELSEARADNRRIPFYKWTPAAAGILCVLALVVMLTAKLRSISVAPNTSDDLSGSSPYYSVVMPENVFIFDLSPASSDNEQREAAPKRNDLPFAEVYLSVRNPDVWEKADVRFTVCAYDGSGRLYPISETVRADFSGELLRINYTDMPQRGTTCVLCASVPNSDKLTAVMLPGAWEP